nr:MAG TPA: hypothetical protein [Crassvirales sp.]
MNNIILVREKMGVVYNIMYIFKRVERRMELLLI